MVAGMPNTSVNDLVLVAEASRRQAQVVAELRQIRAAAVPQLDALQVVPDALVRIQIWCVAGQLLQMDAPGTTTGQEVLDRLPPVNGGAVPDHHQRTGDVAQQMPEEAHHILAAQGALLDQQQELVVGSDAADGREMIVGEGHTQEGRLATRRVGADPSRQQVEPRLVYPDDGAAFGFGLFLIAGQRSAYHASMAASLRWVARSVGCWGLQPMARRRRLT